MSVWLEWVFLTAIAGGMLLTFLTLLCDQDGPREHFEDSRHIRRHCSNAKFGGNQDACDIEAAHSEVWSKFFADANDE